MILNARSEFFSDLVNHLPCLGSRTGLTDVQARWSRGPIEKGSDDELKCMCGQVCRKWMKRWSRNWLELKAASYCCVTGPSDCSGLAFFYIKL